MKWKNELNESEKLRRFENHRMWQNFSKYLHNKLRLYVLKLSLKNTEQIFFPVYKLTEFQY